MFWTKKCSHPFAELRVWSDSTTTPSHIVGNTLVTHRLFCGKCGQKDLDIKYATTSTGLIDGVSPYEKAAEQRDPDNAEAKAFKDKNDPEWVLVPTKFNGIDGNHVYAGKYGEIKFVNPKGKVDMQTIESVSWRMEKDDIQASANLQQTCQDAIDFAIKRREQAQ